MKTENLPVMARCILRSVALGLTDEDICVQYPELRVDQVAKMRSGATFKRALREMQEDIDREIVQQAADDSVLQYLKGKALKNAQVLSELAENADGETPHAVQATCAKDMLDRAGYSRGAEIATIPIIMLSTEKMEAVKKKHILNNIPDSVDGPQENNGMDEY